VDHSLRRRRLADRFGDLDVDGVLVTTLPNVRYLTGFTGSNGQALLSADAGVFFSDGRYDEQSRREVPDLERSIHLGRFPEIPEAVERLGIRRLGFESGTVTHRIWRWLEDEIPGVELVPLGAEVERLRTVKDPDEIELIERAQAAAEEAFERVVTAGLRPGVTERRIALDLEFAMREAGADDRAFETIVAFGEHGAEPHHRPVERVLREGDLVTMDLGAVVDGYHSDMTRTVAIGEPALRLHEIRDLVAEAQAAGIAAVRAGAEGRSIDGAARTVIASAGLGDRFVHGLGHGVGLEIHEPPTLGSDRDDVLQAGSVVTIEPGVYVPDLGGVRIEDMVVVTADGCRPITTSTKELVVG
jgi:Xaa-Pro aminopeptidase